MHKFFATFQSKIMIFQTTNQDIEDLLYYSYKIITFWNFDLKVMIYKGNLDQLFANLQLIILDQLMP